MTQKDLFTTREEVTLFDLNEASTWASKRLNRSVAPENIHYLVQYGRVKNHQLNGQIAISKQELESYYADSYLSRQDEWTSRLGNDLNWHLSFDYLREKDTTKHVHRIHPYKGKFIPQLVEYFLDDHVDEHKTVPYFKRGDIVLDPFAGSGTTLVQANELGMSAVGVDISSFNAQLSNVKTQKHNILELTSRIDAISHDLSQLDSHSKVQEFEIELQASLSAFNKRHFPTPNFKVDVRAGKINEREYGIKYERLYHSHYHKLAAKYDIDCSIDPNGSYLEKWLNNHVRFEVEHLRCLISSMPRNSVRELVEIILTRTIRSCRATRHSDLATLKDPVTEPYYCSKHGKICKPIYSLRGWWNRYTKDTVKRILEFDQLRSDTDQVCLTGDSRCIDIPQEVSKQNPSLATTIKKRGFNGIFTSPPYVGVIDYHEQHAYAYDLLGLERKDNLEIGPLSRGRGRAAQESYVDSIAEVLANCQKYLAPNFNIFVVANDKDNLYPSISQKAGLRIVNRFKRPVLNRTERDKGAYAELIFHMTK